MWKYIGITLVVLLIGHLAYVAYWPKPDAYAITENVYQSKIDSIGQILDSIATVPVPTVSTNDEARLQELVNSHGALLSEIKQLQQFIDNNRPIYNEDIDHTIDWINKRYPQRSGN